MRTTPPDIYNVMNLIDAANLNPNKTKILYCIIVRLNKKRWSPVPVAGAVAGRGMCKETFLKERKALIAEGWIVMRPGQWKTAQPVYDLGPKFNEKSTFKTEKEMRGRDDIRDLVIEIDRQYPDFSGFCARYKWDRAIEIMKARHPELAVSEWPVDSIGDPVNRELAHEMMVELHRRKKEKPVAKVERTVRPADVWTPFYTFVDLWRLTYPKKASRAIIVKAVKDLAKGKEQWAPEQVKALQETITGHTAAYVASFGGDYTYMVSPVNYFAAEKWTEKVSVKRDKNDVHYKTAGAHAIRNMPKITTIRVN